MTGTAIDTLDLDGIDLGDIDLGIKSPSTATAPAAEAVSFPPSRQSSRGEITFDLETVPDESRRSLFGLDEPVVQKPFTNPPISGELWVEFMKRPISQIKEEVDAHNPDETWLQAMDTWERKSAKPRAGVLDIVKNIRASRNPGETAEADKIKKMSVTPEFCRIVAMGIGWNDVAVPGEGPHDVVNGFVVGEGISELELLEWFWDAVKSATAVIGFNIIGFDLPVIFERSILLGVTPSRRFDMSPFANNRDVIDLMTRRWPKGGQLKLKEVAKAMQLEVPAGDCDGSEVYRLFQEDPAKLATYVKSDVYICQQLRRKWAGFWC